MHKEKKYSSKLKPPPGATEEQMAEHPSWRRYTRKYQRKKDIVRNIWIINGPLIACVPLNWQVTLLLATTFLSFCILDETP